MCLHTELKNLRLLKVRLDFFLLSNQAGSSLDLSTFMWVTVTCSFAFLEHIAMEISFPLKVPHGWAVQACSALFFFNHFLLLSLICPKFSESMEASSATDSSPLQLPSERATLWKNKGILWRSCTFGRLGQPGENTEVLCVLVCILRVTMSVTAVKSTGREEQQAFSLPRHEKTANPSPLSCLKYPSCIQLLQHWWLGKFNGEL